MVRAGRSAAYVDDFIEDGFVAIRWDEMGELPPHPSSEDIARAYDGAYPKAKGRRRGVHLGQLRRFYNEIQVGDAVMTYAPNERLYYLGTVDSDVRWKADADLPRQRAVTWTHKVLRDALTASTRNRLGSIATLFLASELPSDELRRKALDLNAEIVEEIEEVEEDDAEEVADEAYEDVVFEDTMLESAAQRIEDRIARLDWHQLEHMVAGVLRAMGYRTTVHEDGADRGVDIFASPDGLGLQEPRIFVEVKHRKGKIGAPAVRSFLGGRNPADRCLYVSTGGFTKDARYEADRSNVPLRLLGMSDLRELLVTHYEGLDTQTRTLVPLRRVYVAIEGVE